MREDEIYSDIYIKMHLQKEGLETHKCRLSFELGSEVKEKNPLKVSQMYLGENIDLNHLIISNVVI